MPLRRLDVSQQIRQLFRLDYTYRAANNYELDSVVEGHLLKYVLSPVNWHVWGLYYFSFVILSLGALLKRSYLLALISVTIYLGTIFQLLIAQDVHRLTGFLIINLILLIIWNAIEGWPIPKLTNVFVILGFLTIFHDHILKYSSYLI